MTNLLLNCDFCKKRYSAIYKDFRNLSNSSPVQSFPNKRLWSLDFALEIVLRPLPRRTAILESDKSLTFIKRHIRKSCALIVHIEKRLSLKDGNSLLASFNSISVSSAERGWPFFAFVSIILHISVSININRTLSLKARSLLIILLLFFRLCFSSSISLALAA